MTKPCDDQNTQRPAGRAILFRLGAIALGLAALALVELLFRLLGWGHPDQHQDPFVGFSSVRPLFTANEADGCYAIPPSRQLFFRPETFNLRKRPGEFRIFCLGGSTVQGRPFALETSFTSWLELSLQAADPDRQWKVVNCGGVSYASYRLVPILEEVLRYEPDLVILYTGHNEFLEDRTYADIKHRSALLQRPQEFASRLRTFTLMREAYLYLQGHSSRQLLGERPVLSYEADAILEYRGGLNQYHRDPSWRAGVIEHFGYDLRRMARMAQEAETPLVLADPVCQLRQRPPFKSQHRDGLSPDQLREWESLVAQAQELAPSDPSGAAQRLRGAIALDPKYAQTFFDLAVCCDALQQWDEAREAYQQAKELDVCPLRILQPMHDILRRVARETNSPLADVRGVISRRCPQGIPGDRFMLDHVHPSIRGHQIIANLLTEVMIGHSMVEARPGWREDRDRKYQEHLVSLENDYYREAEARLQSLEAWAAGKGTRAPRRDPPAERGAE